MKTLKSIVSMLLLLGILFVVQAQGKDDYPDYQKSQSDFDKASSVGNKLGRNRSLYRLGVKTIRNIAKFLDCVDVHRKHRKQKSNIEYGIQRFNANTLANILHRR